MTQWWSNDESRQMHNQPRHYTWYTNSIFGQFRVPTTHWLLATVLATISLSFDLMEKAAKYFNTQMGIKISHVENYSIYVGYNTTLWLAGATALIGPYAWLFLIGARAKRNYHNFGVSELLTEALIKRTRGDFNTHFGIKNFRKLEVAPK